MNDETLQPIFHHLGVLLDYPGADMLETAIEISEMLQLDFPESADQMRVFVDFANDTSLGRLFRRSETVETEIYKIATNHRCCYH